MSKQTYKAEYPIRVGSNVYRPGEAIPDGELSDKDFETFLDSKKISKNKSEATPPPADPDEGQGKKESKPKPTPADSDDSNEDQDEKPEDDSGKETKPESKVKKEFLLGKNKDFTEAKVKDLGLPEEEWKELNKEPLIDYYLNALENVAAAE